MDWIQRGAVLDALQFRCEGCDSRNGVLCSSCETADAIDIVEDAPGAFRWIPCSERLPEKHGEYMVCFNLNGTDVIDKRYYGEKSDGTIVWLSICSSDITHWMPLPDPPEKEG